MTISPADFTFLTQLLRERSGISLSEDKEYLLESRLLPLMRSLNVENIAGLVSLLRLKRDEAVIRSIIEAITTNETLFFRDTSPFNNFRNHIVPHLIKHNKGDAIDVWSAACSSGQEPYSLAMTALENAMKLEGKELRITATDIDTAILKKAQEGIYTQFEVQRGLPITLLMKYFEQEKEHTERWAIKQNVKDMVSFKPYNLLDSYAPLGKFDVIFCRNVLIYFEPETKIDILNRLAGALKPHGVLMLGSAERIDDAKCPQYKQFNDVRGVYCLK